MKLSFPPRLFFKTGITFDGGVSFKVCESIKKCCQLRGLLPVVECISFRMESKATLCSNNELMAYKYPNSRYVFNNQRHATHKPNPLDPKEKIKIFAFIVIFAACDEYSVLQHLCPTTT